jgi:hypothetical protein
VSGSAPDQAQAEQEKYNAPAKYISDYMNGPGTKYLKTNIGNGKIKTMAQFSAALVKAFSEVANKAQFDAPTAANGVQVPIIINNVQTWILFTPNKRVALYHPAEIDLNIARAVVSPDKKLTNSPLARALKSRSESSPPGVAETRETVDMTVTDKLKNISGNVMGVPGTTHAWNADQVVANARKNMVAERPTPLEGIGAGHAPLQVVDIVLGDNAKQTVINNKSALLKALFQQYSVDQLIAQGCISQAGNESDQRLYVIHKIPPEFSQYLNHRPKNSQKSNLEIIAANPLFDIRNDQNAQVFLARPSAQPAPRPLAGS